MDSKVSETMRKVVDQLLAAIAAGADGTGWTRCWRQLAETATARNAATGRRYSGGNAIALALLELAGGAVAPWATYRQWEELGAQVRKGEKGTVVLVPRVTKRERTDRATGEQVESTRLTFGVVYVFHAGQVDGWTAEAAEAAEQRWTAAPDVDAWTAAVIAAGPVRMALGEPAYRPGADLVTMPERAAFDSAAGYYGTLFHELTHWTGPRVGRQVKAERWGDHAYAAEELVAELGAAELCAELGIESTPRADHAEYLAHWLGALDADPSRLWTAASLAHKATEHLRQLAAAGAPSTEVAA